MAGSIEYTEFPHVVDIPWTARTDNITTWNEVCAQAMELFGLPGDRYITQANVNNMSWHFRTYQDAFMMRLKFFELL